MFPLTEQYKGFAVFVSMIVVLLIGTLSAQTHGQVVGWVDGVFGSQGAQYIQGWACEPGNPSPLTVHLYTGGGFGVGQIYSAYVANAAPGDPGVRNACGTTTGHRFYINVMGDLSSRGLQYIFVYGIAQSGGSNNLLNGSGNYRVPFATTLGVVDNVDSSGYAYGWAFNILDSGASIPVAIYADGNALQGAETGTLVWEGPANQARPDVDNAFNITGNHGFAVQLPSWVTTGVHSLSLYPIVNGVVMGPMQGSPTVPGGRKLTTQFSFSTSAPGFPSQWYGYNLPADPVNLVGLSGTVSMNNTANVYSEMLFIVGYLPTGSCPTSGTTAQWGRPGTSVVWTNIIKGPTAGTFSAPVSFTLPVGKPVSNCLLVGINGGTVSTSHTVTGTVNLVVTYTENPLYPTQELPFGG